MIMISNLLLPHDTKKHKIKSQQLCSCLGANSTTGMNFRSKLWQHRDGNWDETFTRLSPNKELLILPPDSLSLFFVCMCVCLWVCVCSCFWSCSLADIYRHTQGGAVGSHSIEEAPGSSEAFSLPLGSVWAAEQNLPLPNPAPGTSLRQNYKGPPTAGSSFCSPSFSQPPPTPLRLPSSISCRYSIHRRRALITKQDYGPCLGTTCQGACSLSTTHTLQRRVLFACFWKGGGHFPSSDGETVQIIVKSLLKCFPSISY